MSDDFNDLPFTIEDDDSFIVEEEGLSLKETHRGNGQGDTDFPTLLTRCALDVEVKPVSWLWPDRLPYGKIVIVAGEPGLGKSRLMLSMAAIISTGRDWPAGEGRCEPGEVLIASFEDDHEDTTVPRLMAEGADLKKIHFLDAVPTNNGQRALDLNRDAERIAMHMEQNPGTKLIAIDPISAVMGRIDSHKNTVVRAVLHPLVIVARQYDVCVLAITHLNKSSGGKALHRVIDSIAFTAAARVAYVVSKDESDPDGKKGLLIPIKNNIARDVPGLSFNTEEVVLPCGIVAPRIKWGDPVSLTADEALTTEEHKGALREAMDFLTSFLANGPMPAKKVRYQASQCGITERTLSRAKAALGVKTQRKGGTGSNGHWIWELPA